MQEILLKIVESLENVAVSVDALEAALIQRGQLTTGEINQYAAIPRQSVCQYLAPIRAAIMSIR